MSSGRLLKENQSLVKFYVHPWFLYTENDSIAMKNFTAGKKKNESVRR